MKLLITGGRSQIAMALAERQQRAGHDVIVTASTARGTEEVRDRYAEHGIPVKVVEFALDPDRPIAGELAEVITAGVDAVVLNASGRIERFKLAHQLESAEIRSAVSRDIEGNLHLLRAVLPGMKRRNFGRLVFVSSAMVASGTSRHGLYCMTKAAMEALFLNLAVDYSRFNVLANVVRPGIVQTDRTARFWKKAAYVERAQKAIPQGALGQPAQIAECFDPLLSPTSYMTGSIVTVGGGLPLLNLSGL